MTPRLGKSFLAASLLLAVTATAYVLPIVALGPLAGLLIGFSAIFLLYWRLAYLVAEVIGE